MANEVEIVVSATDKTKPGFDQAKKNAEGLKGSLKSVGTVAAGVLSADLMIKAGAAFGRFVGDSIRQASDLGESVNAVNKTFGSSAKEIQDWGKNNATSFGLSTAEFNKMATPLGASLKNAGLSLQDTSKWTIDLTKRASDMASVFNTTVPEALDAIQAGLRGESDPLEKFGVGLSAAKVEARALADTGKTTASSLTDQEKATARLNVIMEQTSSTAGDFADTSDQYANATRIATAEIDNAKAALGQALLPVLAKVATAAGAAAAGFSALPGPMQATIVVTSSLVAVVGLLAPKVKKASAAMKEMGTSSFVTSGHLGAMARAAGRAVGVLTAVNIAGAAMSRDMTVGVNTATTALEDFAKTGKSTATVGLNLDDAWKWVADDARWDNKAVNTFLKSWEGLSGTGGAIGDSFEHAKQAFASADAALVGMVQSGEKAKAADIFSKLAADAAEQGVSIDELKRQFPQYTDALAGAARANTGTAGAAKDLNKEMADQAKKAEAAADALLGSRGAMRDLEAAYDDATSALKENGKTTSIETEKGRANQSALDGIASAAAKAGQALVESKASQEQVNRVMATARSRYIATATAMGIAKPEAERLAKALFSIPKVVSTKATVNTASALSSLNTLVDRIGWVNGHRVRIKASVDSANVRESRASGGLIGHAAEGGPRGGEVLVGEYGPELVELAPGSRVHSNPDTQRKLSERGGSGQPMVVQLNLDGRTLARLLIDPLRREVRSIAGGDVQAALGRG